MIAFNNITGDMVNDGLTIDGLDWKEVGEGWMNWGIKDNKVKGGEEAWKGILALRDQWYNNDTLGQNRMHAFCYSTLLLP